MGAFERNDECVFLFSIDNFSKTENRYIRSYFDYNTKMKKLTEFNEYKGKGKDYIYMKINPSGEYVAITKRDRLSDKYFYFDIIKTGDLL